ncbi:MULTISPECIES: hypothetical protein [Gordonia]|uniref:Bacteriocin biosynthesis cyclodehydratase domain-containing protein n=2 Tax=Gordonia TaxID=2053 RepID=L7LJD1_9ACTN|nr:MULTISPECIES: hypothetical protein [Gordonia]MBY4569925.1 hypothetical protein [Gordonia sihwensis]GAC60163.1 hypothetical protein GSI01S_08_00180 [Gordonia sihwensis NBRC 108236]
MPARDALPVLTSGTPVLIRPDGRLHIGSDPLTALTVELGRGVSTAAVAALLQRLRTPQRYRHLRRDLRSSGLSASRFWEMLDRLVAAGKAVESETVASARLAIGIVGHGEIARLLLSGLPLDGHRTEVCDPRGPLGGPGPRPQLVVLADQPVPDPAVYEPLMSARIPHLAVHIHDDVGVVGPLVLPGATSCLRCLELHRTDVDPGWPVLAATLQGVAGAGGTATRLATVAMAHAQIGEIGAALRAADPAPPAVAGKRLEFRPLPCGMTLAPAPVHPRCECFVRCGGAPGETVSTILDHAAKGHH